MASRNLYRWVKHKIWPPYPDAEVWMVLEELTAVPHFDLPPGYSIRLYQPGNEMAWLTIHKLADEFNLLDLADYRREFGEDTAVIAERQFYLLNPYGEPIGTATAWMDRVVDGVDWGQVHWVAIVPAYQGKGLSKPLLTAVLEKMCELGHQKAMLETATVRLPAINLYWQFGFRPLIRNEADKQIWAQVKRKLRF